MADPLFQLATRVFHQTENLVWGAGIGPSNFPLASGADLQWEYSTRWVLSPETEIGGLKLRLCLSVPPTGENLYNRHVLRVFVNGLITAPGGILSRPTKRTWTYAWDCDVAQAALVNNGRAGHIKSPERFLADLEKVKKSDAPVCAMCKAALDEVDAIGKPKVRT